MNDTRQKLKLVMILEVIYSALYGVNWLDKVNHGTYRCQSNLKNIGSAMWQYARDYDEKNLLAGNWRTALYPYGVIATLNDNINTRKMLREKCPAGNGYAFNRHLSGIGITQVDNLTGTPSVYDSLSKQPNASDFGTSWPKDGAHSMLRRGRGTNVLFYDMHVEWMQRKPIFRAIKIPSLPKPPKKAAKTPAPR